MSKVFEISSLWCYFFGCKTVMYVYAICIPLENITHRESSEKEHYLPLTYFFSHRPSDEIPNSHPPISTAQQLKKRLVVHLSLLVRQKQHALLRSGRLYAQCPVPFQDKRMIWPYSYGPAQQLPNSP